MPRIRSIKPELATSRKLAGIPIEARYTLVLLVTQADDEGFVYAEPRQLLGHLYPHDDTVTADALEAWILALVRTKSIALRWTVDGARVVQILGWLEHQVVKNPGKPKISPTLLPLSGGSTEILRRLSVESGGAEVVGSEVVGSEVGDSEDGVAATSLVDCFAAHDHRTAYLGYRKAHRFPDAFDATLRSLVQPMTGGEALPWARLGAALVEMRGASADFSPNAVRGFARRIGEAPKGTNGKRERSPQERAEQDAKFNRGEMF